MTTFKPRRCRECGGTIALAEAGGQAWRYRYAQMTLPAGTLIPTCDGCGEQYLGARDAKRLDTVLTSLYAARLIETSRRSVERLREIRSQRALEKLLGLSQGYLSKVIGGSSVPGEPLVGQLALLAKDPKRRIAELEKVWAESPPAWLDR